MGFLKTKTPEETMSLGENLGKSLEPGDIVLLFGDLGAGKTTLTQGICKGLGLPRGEYIRSPTFTLINEYQGKFPIYHIDLYRMESLEEIEGLGLEEVLFGEGVSIVEWSEKLFPVENNQVPFLGIAERIEVRITHENEFQRSFSIQPVGLSARSFPDFSLQ
jgi:tRNA threonylcarbamoyladenosine biosynthesis protein TsaE